MRADPLQKGAGASGATDESAETTALDDLLRKTAGGDRDAFRKLYEQTSPRLMGIAMRMVRDRAVAEDVLQEAYLSVWEKAAQFRPERGHVLAWMTVITRNRAIDRLRVRARSGATLESLPEPALPAADDLGAMAVRRCLEGLAESHRRALTFAYYYGLTHPELAERLAMPLGTVKSWVRRGLIGLRDCLENEEAR